MKLNPIEEPQPLKREIEKPEPLRDREALYNFIERHTDKTTNSLLFLSVLDDKKNAGVSSKVIKTEVIDLSNKTKEDILNDIFVYDLIGDNGIHLNVNRLIQPVRRKENIDKILYLFLDLDDPQPTENEELKQELEEMGIKYSYHAKTRGGYHYLIDLDLDEPIKREANLKGFLHYLKSKYPSVDTMTYQAQQNISVMGSHNQKDEKPFKLKTLEYRKLSEEEINNNNEIVLKYYKEVKNTESTIDNIQTTTATKLNYDEVFFKEILNKDNRELTLRYLTKGNTEGIDERFRVFMKNLAFFVFRNEEYKPIVEELLIQWDSTRIMQLNNYLKSTYFDKKRVSYGELSSWVLKYKLIEWYPLLLQQKVNKEEHYKQIVERDLRSGFQLLDLEELRNKKDERVPYIQELYSSESVNMIYSPPKTMKSFIALNMALSIATGEPFLRQRTTEAKVLYVDYENGEFTLKERINGYVEGMKYDWEKVKENLKLMSFPTSLFIQDGRELTISPETKEYFFNMIRDNNIKVLFFDTFRRIGNFDENDSRAVNIIYNELFLPLQREFKLCVVFLHHTTKPSQNSKGTYRGSGDILGMVTTAYSIDNDELKQTITLRKEQSRNKTKEMITCSYDIKNKEEIVQDVKRYTIETIKLSVDNPTDKLSDNVQYAKVREVFKNNLIHGEQYKTNALINNIRDILKIKDRKGTTEENGIIKQLKTEGFLVSVRQGHYEYRNEEESIKNYLKEEFSKDVDTILLTDLKYNKETLDKVINKYVLDGFLYKPKPNIVRCTEAFKLELGVWGKEEQQEKTKKNTKKKKGGSK